MRPPENEVLHKLIADWGFRADQDIRASETLLAADPPCLYPACFHAQQAAEKYLKAFLTWRQVEFPKTRSIRELLDLAKTVDPLLAAALKSAASLTPYGVEMRYPGDQAEPSLGETRHAMNLAQQVRDAILPLLPSRL